MHSETDAGICQRHQCASDRDQQQRSKEAMELQKQDQKKPAIKSRRR